MNTMNIKGIEVIHMTSEETTKKVDAAIKNGYVEFANLPAKKQHEIMVDLGTMMAVCTPSIAKYVMDCQMGLVNGCFFEVDGKPILLTTEKFLEIFNIAMCAKRKAA